MIRYRYSKFFDVMNFMNNARNNDSSSSWWRYSFGSVTNKLATATMGAAVGIELQKPLDASDIRESGSLDIARGEVMKLRASLGKYAASAGFAEVVFDASDLVQGIDETEDFERCIAEVAHIRR